MPRYGGNTGGDEKNSWAGAASVARRLAAARASGKAEKEAAAATADGALRAAKPAGSSGKALRVTRRLTADSSLSLAPSSLSNTAPPAKARVGRPSPDASLADSMDPPVQPRITEGRDQKLSELTGKPGARVPHGHAAANRLSTAGSSLARASPDRKSVV